jgi:hypothetical protein
MWNSNGDVLDNVKELYMTRWDGGLELGMKSSTIGCGQ